uniref:Uncharacterized protein n=1 Tax=Panagrolaimus sp. ES5 TaxID=591445 RepID=A0AC34GU82_9BILA
MSSIKLIIRRIGSTIFATLKKGRMWQIIGICLLLAIPSTSAVGCKDQNNKDVDWFVGYKMPRTNDSSLQGVGKGVAFYYMDLNMDSFAPSPNDMTSNQQAIAYTLQQYYDNKG